MPTARASSGHRLVVLAVLNRLNRFLQDGELRSVANVDDERLEASRDMRFGVGVRNLGALF